jgi:hypothetical protein
MTFSYHLIFTAFDVGFFQELKLQAPAPVN